MTTSDNYKNSEETWNTIAKSFDSTRSKPWQQCTDFINSLSIESIVADIACGNGRHLIQCAKHCKRAIGVDFSKNLLDIVQKKLDENNITNVILHHSDAVDLPLETSSIDAVIFIAALHNIKGREKRIKSLKEIKRVLKNDGKALISVWSREQDKFRDLFKEKKIKSDKCEYGDIQIYWKQNGLDIPRFYHLYSKEEFVKDLEQSGFNIISIRGVKLCSKVYDDNYFAIVE